MKLILDTNLWISYLISNRFIKLDELMKEDRITFLFSRESLEEFIEVASRSKLEKYFKKEDLTELLLYFNSYGEIVEITSDLEICRDPKDNFLLNLANGGEADFLITGDKDLLDIGRLGKTLITTYRVFEEKFRNK